MSSKYLIKFSKNKKRRTSTKLILCLYIWFNAYSRIIFTIHGNWYYSMHSIICIVFACFNIYFNLNVRCTWSACHIYGIYNCNLSVKCVMQSKSEIQNPFSVIIILRKLQIKYIREYACIESCIKMYVFTFILNYTFILKII